MNRLPDIIVLDFCIWLSEKVKSNGNNGELLIDALSQDHLISYAKLFLRQRRFDVEKHNFPIRSIFEGFLSSNEFNMLNDKWRDYYKIHNQNEAIKMLFMFEEAFHHYLLHYFDQLVERKTSYYDISPYELAHYIPYYLKSSGKNSNERPIMALMLQTQYEVADLINFLEWILQHKDGELSFENMPPEIFDTLVDDYIKDTGKSTKESEKLRNEYLHTGWTAIFERIQRWFNLSGKRPTRSLSYVMDRYLSKKAKFNCVILPLSNPKSRDQFASLVKDMWKDLNELSGDDLDIYYSETDIGKTGYDIAMRLHSLPDNLRKMAPCIVIWKDNISEAKAVQIDELNEKQIFETIKTIVNQIKKFSDPKQCHTEFDGIGDNELQCIVEEAMNTVKENQFKNYGVPYIHRNDGNIVIGEKNIINNGDNNNFADVSGDHNSTVNDNTTKINKEFIKEIDSAISAIKDSDEIDEDSKGQLLSIMEDTKKAETENSDEKRNLAQKAFGYVKGLLAKSAPKLFSNLSKLTKFANFFKL